MRKLVVNTGMGFNEGETAMLEKLAKIGWDGVFTGFDDGKGNYEVAKKIRDLGLYYQSVHAPYTGSYRMWEEGKEGDWEMTRQIRCAQNCSEIGVDLMVMHAIIGFNRHTPTSIGIDRYGKVFEAAKKYGVRVAVENTEGQEYLDALMDAFKSDENVGFCIDTGHEMCYNESRDLITKFGAKLFSTHLNDNMAITGDTITWLDDSHMLPFDGKADWLKIAERLNNVGYAGPLTFELTSLNKPERHTHDMYSKMDFEEFATLAFEKAKRFRDIVENK